MAGFLSGEISHPLLLLHYLDLILDRRTGGTRGFKVACRIDGALKQLDRKAVEYGRHGRKPVFLMYHGGSTAAAVE